MAQIARAAVADGDRRIGPPAALHHQRRHRLADNVAPAHDHAVRAGGLHAGPNQQLLHTRRGGRHEAISLAYQPLAHVDRVKAVDILSRIDGADDRVGVDLLRHRHLHEEPMNCRIRVQLMHLRQQLILRRRGRQPDGYRVHAGLLARLALHPHVHRARGILANQYDRQPRTHATLSEVGNPNGELAANGARDCCSVDDLSGQNPPPLSRGSPRP